MLRDFYRMKQGLGALAVIIYLIGDVPIFSTVEPKKGIRSIFLL